MNVGRGGDVKAQVRGMETDAKLGRRKKRGLWGWVWGEYGVNMGWDAGGVEWGEVRWGEVR